MALDDKHWNVRNLILWDKSKPEEGHCQSVVPGYLKKQQKKKSCPRLLCVVYICLGLSGVLPPGQKKQQDV